MQSKKYLLLGSWKKSLATSCCRDHLTDGDVVAQRGCLLAHEQQSWPADQAAGVKGLCTGTACRSTSALGMGEPVRIRTPGRMGAITRFCIEMGYDFFFFL